jgi:hypothetical protein
MNKLRFARAAHFALDNVRPGCMLRTWLANFVTPSSAEPLPSPSECPLLAQSRHDTRPITGRGASRSTTPPPPLS